MREEEKRAKVGMTEKGKEIGEGKREDKMAAMVREIWGTDWVDETGETGMIETTEESTRGEGERRDKEETKTGDIGEIEEMRSHMKVTLTDRR